MTNIATATVAFQTDLDTIKRHLDEIQAEWTEQGIDTPVLDEYDDIDPDAEAELQDRLPIPESAYVLMDADDATRIGPATKEQVQASLAAHEYGGIIKIDADGSVVYDHQARSGPPTPESVRRVYVEV